VGRGIKLTEAQWDKLDRLLLPTASADVFRNCLIILKSACGRPMPQLPASWAAKRTRWSGHAVSTGKRASLPKPYAGT